MTLIMQSVQASTLLSCFNNVVSVERIINIDDDMM